MSTLIYNIIFLCVLLSCHAREPCLSNIEQLTFFQKGFLKAGEAYFSPDGSMISFQAVPVGEEDYQIFTLDLQTKKIVKISQNPGACTCSFFHPRGEKIIFAASPLKTMRTSGQYKWDLTPYMNIYEANIDGTQCKALTHGAAYHAECAYSPDGSRIVYASNENGSMNIYTMAHDGTDVKQLTHTHGCYNGGPFFSPDGSKILFRADRNVPHYLQIYMMDIDGGNLTQLTDNNAVNWAPFWHPDGNIIAFTSSILGHHHYQVFLMHLLTNEIFQITDRSKFNGLPTFNRDGTKLLWTSKRSDDSSTQVFIADFNLNGIK